MSWLVQGAVLATGPAWALAAAWLLERTSPRAVAWLLDILEPPSE